MKQTPIPEKIKSEDYSQVLEEIKNVMDNPTGLALLTSLRFFIDKHNSLIDVLTEQQKEIDGLKGCIRSHAIIAHGKLKEPEYCKCRDPFPCHPISEEFNCGKCHACGRKRKPQEDVKVDPNNCGCIKNCWSLPRIRKTYCACKHGIIET